MLSSRIGSSALATVAWLVCAPLLPACSVSVTTGAADLARPADGAPAAADLGSDDLGSVDDLGAVDNLGAVDDLAPPADLGGDDLRDAGAPAADLTPPNGGPDLASLSVEIVAPAAAQVYGAPFAVTAIVHGGDATDTVAAQLDGAVVPLALGSGSSNTWQANQLAPSKDGHYTLTVTAQAPGGAQAKATVDLDYLTAAPTLTVRAPQLDDAAYGPTMHVDATCNSPVSGCVIHTYLSGCSGTSAADGTDTLVTDLQTYAIMNGSNSICLQAVDRAGHTVTTPPLRVHVIMGDTQHPSLYDADQEIFAANFDQPTWQIVHGHRSLPTVYTQTTVIDETQPMTLQLDTVLAPAAPQTSVAVDGFVRGRDEAWVAPGGAVLSTQPGGGGTALYRTLPGGVSTVVAAAAPASLRVNGDWAAWVDGSELYTLQLSQPDLATALVHLGSGQSIDIASNGVYAYTTIGSGSCGGSLVWNGGAPLPLAVSDVRTDGSSAVFQTYDSSCAPGLARFDGQNVVWTLAQQVDSYAVNNGWVAYTFFSLDSISEEANLVASDGTLTQSYQMIGPGTMEALAQDGTFTFTTQGTRWLADANDDYEDLESGDGRVYVTANGLYVTLGRSVFLIQYP
ncbi:MAG TPA: hypothetical protein VIA18_07530 [Polyangia bacterium]|nr:hypothetical protein [Polyangia bacterium]